VVAAPPTFGRGLGALEFKPFRDGRETVKLSTRTTIYPTAPSSREGKWLAFFDVNRYGHLALSLAVPRIHREELNIAITQ
jgi:hypothetical protein